LASFAEAGLTFEDYQKLGLGDLVTREAVDEARQRGAGKPR
jgi:ribosomal protein S18 acetylase RimI-like enzyme